jgi:tetratricopeptide (TPR) repeat protein
VPHVLTAEGQRIKAAVSDHTARADDVAAAIRRHPADYYLELMAATEAFGRHDPTAGRHLNRAQRLNPSDPWVHLSTARWLASLGKRSQAALEYRLGADRGGPINYDELVAMVGPSHLAEAVPQTPRPLMEVARMLAARGDVRDAIDVSARAVAASQRAEPVLVERLQLAVGTHASAFVRDAAADLLAAANEPTSYVAVAQALDQFGQRAKADAAIDQGLTANPRDAALVIAGARLHVGHDDLTGAVAILMRGKEAVYTLDDRLQLEELRASIAERRGDAGTATAIRARAKAMARLHTTELP